MLIKELCSHCTKTDVKTLTCRLCADLKHNENYQNKYVELCKN